MQALTEKIKNEVVRRVYKDFFDEVMSSREHFDYDEQYFKITDAIAVLAGNNKKQYFQWVIKREVLLAQKMNIPSIKKIPGPSSGPKEIVLPPWPNQS